MQQGDHDGVGPVRPCPADRVADLLRIHRGLDGSVLKGPLGDAVDPLAWGEGRRSAREEVVGVRHLEARDLEDVLEPRVVKRASAGPRRWMTVFTPTVVPWVK